MHWGLRGHTFSHKYNQCCIATGTAWHQSLFCSHQWRFSCKFTIKPFCWCMSNSLLFPSTAPIHWLQLAVPWTFCVGFARSPCACVAWVRCEYSCLSFYVSLRETGDLSRAENSWDSLQRTPQPWVQEKWQWDEGSWKQMLQMLFLSCTAPFRRV